MQKGRKINGVGWLTANVPPPKELPHTWKDGSIKTQRDMGQGPIQSKLHEDSFLN